MKGLVKRKQLLEGLVLMHLVHLKVKEIVIEVIQIVIVLWIKLLQRILLNKWGDLKILKIKAVYA
jgi:hypothetical protein